MISVNGQVLEFGTYPNGETLVPDLPVAGIEVPTVVWTYDGDYELVRLALVCGLLGQQAHLSFPRLIVTYMPYSRMDREQGGHCFSLRYIGRMIAEMNWSSIHVVEPHSAVTMTETIHHRSRLRAEPVWTTAELTPLVMAEIDFDKQRDYLVVPDAGAHARYAEQLGQLFEECNIITLRKRRDFETGEILGLEVASRKFHSIGNPQRGARALIIDDLCSRGGTFLQARQILRHSSIGCQAVYLLVTHMEQVGYTGELGWLMDGVYCTDSMGPAPKIIPDCFHVFERTAWL